MSQLMYWIATISIALGAGPLGAQSTPTATGRPAPEATVDIVPALTYSTGNPEGFYWYREREAVIVVPAPPKPEPRPASRAPELTAFEAMQERLETLKKIAIMNPSIANLRSFMRYQGMVLDKAGTFAEQWQRTLALTPELDTSDRIRPTNTAAARAFDERQGETDRAVLAAYAKTHGLYFYFRSDCPYCHAFAPVVKRFAANTGFTVMPISLDGSVLPDFPEARRDNGSAARVIEGGITTVPALVLFDAASGTRTPVSFGVLSDAELAERLRLMLTLSKSAMQARD